MTNDKNIIISYAKKLYLTYNGEGVKKYSLREICTKIEQKLHKKVAPNTIKNWAEKFKWNETNEKAKILGIEKAKNEKFTIDEKVIEAKSDDLALIYKLYSNVLKASSNVISEAYKKGEITTKEAITAMKNAADVMMKINEVPDITKTEISQINIPMIKFIND